MRVRRFGFYTRATEVKTPLDIYLQRYSRLSARYTVQRYDQLWYVLGSDELGAVARADSPPLPTRRQQPQQTQRLRTALSRLPRDIVKEIGKRIPLLIPPFTNNILHRTLQDHLAGVTVVGNKGSWLT